MDLDNMIFPMGSTFIFGSWIYEAGDDGELQNRLLESSATLIPKDSIYISMTGERRILIVQNRFLFGETESKVYLILIVTPTLKLRSTPKSESRQSKTRATGFLPCFCLDSFVVTESESALGKSCVRLV